MKRSNKKRMQIYIIITIVLIALLLAVSMEREVKVVKYNVKSSKLSNGIKLALITDLHSCDYGEGQIDILTKIYDSEPDVVLLGGDIVDDRLPQDKAKEFLSAVSQRYPCFYVSGNHEYRSGKVSEIKRMIGEYGIFVLEGETIKFKVKGETLYICGIDDPELGEERFEEQLKSCADGINEDKLSILLTHRPERVDSYRLGTFDLILAGHAHGGQWRIPGILNGLLAPNQGFFPKYAGGIYEFTNMKMIVSRGLAKESTRIPRMFNPPELVIIQVDSIDEGE